MESVCDKSPCLRGIVLMIKRREVNGRRAQAIYGHVVEDDGTKHTPIYSLGRNPYQVQAKQYVAMGGIQFVFRHRTDDVLLKYPIVANFGCL